ncbi:unnamed protein product [Durusdinium trenchii]|uniref:PPM-type phosphatase domain-containing protein n=1 Tax=Durusdinium trenchii TaxID=1381693 RepID=A0ABP0SIC0_9DINO
MPRERSSPHPLLKRVEHASPELLKGLAAALASTPLRDVERQRLLRGLKDATLWQHAIEHLVALRTSSLRCTLPHLHTCAQAREWPLAWRLLRTAETWHLQRDVVSFNILIGRPGSWTHALHVGESCMAAMDVEKDTTTRNLVMGLHDQLGRWPLALDFWQRTVCANSGVLVAHGGRWDVASYSILMRGGSVADRWPLALMFLEEMWRAELRVDVTALNTALSVVAWPCTLELLQMFGTLALAEDIISYNTAMNACEKTLRWANAAMLLLEAGSCELRASETSYNSCASSFFKSKKWIEALDLASMTQGTSGVLGFSSASFWRSALFLAQGAVPHVDVAWSAVLSSCEASAEWEMALASLERAFEHHLEVSLVLNNAAISAISAGATAVTASTWQVGVERLLLAASRQLRVDVIGYNALCSAQEKSCVWHQVLSLASQLAARSLRTDAFAAGAVFFASKEAVGGRTWQRTLRLADWVAERQVELDVIKQQAVLAALATRGQALKDGCERLSGSAVSLLESLPKRETCFLETPADESLGSLDERPATRSTGERRQELGALSLVAKGCALSGALGRHPIYGRVAHDAALALEAGTPPPARTVHDIALALSLLGPWDAQIDKAVQRFRQALVPLDRSVQSTQVDSCGASSMAGQRNGENKENQDTFYISVDASVASVAVVDGHGRRGAILSAAGRDALADLLRRMKSCSAEELAQGILLVDAELLIHEKAEPELSGATCAVMRIEGISQPKRRLLLAHLGDCGAVLGRCSKGTNGSSGTPSWSTRRLTEDHRPGERLEAARLIAAGGRVQKMPPPPQAQVDPANMGPPRLWHRQQGNAPGLAMSRGLGDALGKACGLSPEATTLEMELNEEDVVIVLGSDGIFDVLSDAEILHCCRQFIEKRSATEAAAAVTQSARQQWLQRGPYVDDCTCVVLFL